MGRVHAPLEIANAFDLDRFARGEIAYDAVRKIAISRALVDTGATHLCLPLALIQQLGLRLRGEVPLDTAAGLQSSRIYRGAEVTVLGRSDTFSCLELPGGSEPLLGVIVMEALGLQVDVSNHRLELRPESGPHGYISAS